KATNNTPDPLKHRNFLKALDIIGQNNIKALYVGVAENEEKSNDKNIEEDEDGVKNTESKEEKKQPPKMIGRLATTIIMKNGLCIG
ncbi:hypothetical protein KJQ85_08850, partial [Campylobacter lari]|nr:hypothetical protein [Campylobacter lari]